MGGWTQVSIDFETSHLVFPTIIGLVLALLGAAILVRDRARIADAPVYWQGIWSKLDKVRFFGTLILMLAYFGLMVPVGDVWPNTGMGFLLCSIPFIFAIGTLYLHERTFKTMLPVAILALVAPPLTWWLFFHIFFLSLP